MSGILAITFCGITMKNYVEQVPAADIYILSYFLVLIEYQP